MIQTHNQLKITSEEYNSLFTKNEFYPLQRAYTTPHFLVFIVRFAGKSVVLYIGRGNQYQGIYLHDKIPPTYLRVQDRLLDYARKYLVGARLGRLEIDEKYMVSRFAFKNDHENNLFVIGYKDRQLFFIKQAKKEIYLSWNGETLAEGDLHALIESFNPDRANFSKNSLDLTIIKYLEEEEKKISGKPIQRKKEKFLDRKIKNITNDLDGVRKWNLIRDDLQGEVMDLDHDEIKTHGQKIKMHGLHSIWQKKDLIFKKIKKLKKAEEILTNRLLDSLQEFESVKAGNFEFELTKEKVIQPLWSVSGKNLKITNKEYNYKNFQLKNLAGVIALDALSNDYIRSQASKEHYWYHVENYPGSHLILKTDDISKLTMDDLALIASLLRDFSKLSILEIPIVYSQVKNIKGVKGSKGEVIIKKAKYLRCQYRDWKEIITVI